MSSRMVLQVACAVTCVRYYATLCVRYYATLCFPYYATLCFRVCYALCAWLSRRAKTPWTSGSSWFSSVFSCQRVRGPVGPAGFRRVLPKLAGIAPKLAGIVPNLAGIAGGRRGSARVREEGDGGA
eukprot:2982625-Rhodomonas_salina.1